MKDKIISLLSLIEEVTDKDYKEIPQNLKEQVQKNHPLSVSQKKWILRAIEIRLLGSKDA